MTKQGRAKMRPRKPQRFSQIDSRQLEEAEREDRSYRVTA